MLRALDMQVDAMNRSDGGIFLSDTTLRDGEQSFGIVFNDEERVQIALALNDAGVREIEAGFPAVSPERTGYLDELVRLRRSGRITSRLIGWHRPVPDEVAHSAARGLDGCAISVPSSAGLIRDVLGKDEAWVIDQMRASVGRAKDCNLYVVADYQDAFAADEGFLIALSTAMRDAGADRIRLCDTVGRTTPEQVTKRLGSLMDAVDTDLELHAHNDLGLAVANALASVDLLQSRGDGRAFYIACTVNGLGERTGNTALEVIALVLAKTRGLGVIDLTRLADLCQMVAEMTGRPVPVNAPIVGINNWRHASGLHVDGVTKSTSSYELLEPTEVGYPDSIRELTCGQYGGRAALRTLLAQYSLEIAESGEQTLLELLSTEIVSRKRYLSRAEVEVLCRNVIAGATEIPGQRLR